MSPRLYQRHCLIIDDASRDVLSQVFESENWSIAVCASIGETEIRIRETAPTALALDFDRLDFDAAAFCQRVRATPQGREIFIFACTSRSDTASLTAVLEAGADDCAIRPIDPAFLRARVRLVDAGAARRRQKIFAEEEASVFKFCTEAGPTPIFWMDPAQDFRFIWVNDAGCGCLARSREEILRLRLDDCDPTFGREEAGQFRQRLRAESSWVTESLLLRGDGAAVPVEITFHRLLPCNKELVTGCIRDISYRRRAEAALDRATLLLSRLRDAVFCTELDGTVSYWNEAAERLYGWAAGEMIGRPLHQRYPGTEAAEMRALLSRVAGGEDWNGEWLDFRKDGSRVWTDTSIERFLDRDGRTAGLIGMAHDITSRKQAEQERSDLEHKLQETQKLESLGVLAGGIAHDFNNLLTGILGNASLARLELSPTSLAAGFVQQIEEAGLRAAELCQQMLAYSGKAQFVEQSLSLSRLVEETARLLHLSIGKKAKLELDLDPDVPAVHGDATQLRQVIMNLVINASEALGPREGRIAVSVRPVEVSRARLALMHGGNDAPEGAGVEISVRDDGCGMNAETVARIFEPFFTTKFTGRGLGLSAVLGIVRSHHGAIEVSSVPGHGTSFTIVLPAAGAVPIEPDSPIPESLWRGKGTILVVDDEEAVRDVLHHLLLRMGFSVETAVDGRDAINRYRPDPGRFAAVLLDLTMPRCNGLEALRELRALRSDAVVLLMTGHGCADVATQVGYAAPDALVQKPFTADSLRNSLHQALEGRRNLQPALRKS